MATSTKKTKTDPVDTTAFEGIIKDLSDIFGKANKADDDLSKAKEKHKGAGDQSIRAVAARVAGINHPLPPEAIDAIASSVGDKLSGGNSNVKKSRKSEIKLILEQRTHLSTVLAALDAEVAKRPKDAKPINVRQHALGCLRAIKSRKPEHSHIVDAATAVEDLVTTLDADPADRTDADRVFDLLDKLAAFKALQVDDGAGGKRLHATVEAFVNAINAHMAGEEDALTAVFGDAPQEEPKTAEEAVLDALGITIAEVVEETVQEAVQEALTTAGVVVPPPLPEPAPEKPRDMHDVLADIVKLV
jgi:hypothetical protein